MSEEFLNLVSRPHETHVSNRFDGWCYKNMSGVVDLLTDVMIHPRLLNFVDLQGPFRVLL